MIKFKNNTIIMALVAILFSFIMVVTATTAASTQSNATSQSEGDSVWFSSEEVLSFASVVIAGGVALTGIFTYRQNKKKELLARENELHTRKKELLTQIIMPLLKEYNELNEAEIAIDILDDYPYEFNRIDDSQAYRLYSGVIDKKDLPLVLRKDEWIDTSPVEDKVVRSFDALLYFFAELEYVVQIGLVKRDDLKLFDYEIQKVVKQPAILNFVNIHRLSYFKKQLNDKLQMEDNNEGENIVGDEVEKAEYFKRLKDAGIRT
jgi:hypothetical protein